MPTLQEGLEEYFSSAIHAEGVMDECLKMCTELKLLPEDLFYKWEAFSYSASSKDRVMSSLTLDGAKSLHQQLRQQQQQQATQASFSTPVSSRLKTVPKSAIRGFSSSKISSSPLATPRPAHASRLVPQTPIIVNHRPQVQYAPPESLSEYDYRYMHEKLSDRADALDDLIDEFAEVVKLHYNLEELGDPSAMSEEESVVIGRICCDTDEKLNESSIMLESSRALGSGRRVPISFQPHCVFKSDLSGRPGFSMYPGQIAVFKGKNGDGRRFLVSEVWTLPRLPPAHHTPSSSSITTDDSISLLVACGPFSYDRDLEFEPLSKLIQQAQRQKPSVLLLIGPFVDSNNALIKSYSVTETPTETFHKLVSSKLDALVAAVPNISIFLVPSVRDIAHEHLAVPQNVFNKERLGISKHINVLPNPCVFTVNGVSIGVSSLDVLFHIGGQQLLKRMPEFPAPLSNTLTTSSTSSAPLDNMHLLSRQVLEQRSFYPLFPVPRDLASTVNLDVTHSHLLRLGDTAPDILILPSRLKGFHKVVDRTLVVNPGYITRGAALDTYAKMSIPSLPSVQALPEGSEGSQGSGTDLPELTSVYISKLADN